MLNVNRGRYGAIGRFFFELWRHFNTASIIAVIRHMEPFKCIFRSTLYLLSPPLCITNMVLRSV